MILKKMQQRLPVSPDQHVRARVLHICHRTPPTTLNPLFFFFLSIILSSAYYAPDAATFSAECVSTPYYCTATKPRHDIPVLAASAHIAPDSYLDERHLSAKRSRQKRYIRYCILPLDVARSAITGDQHHTRSGGKH